MELIAIIIIVLAVVGAQALIFGKYAVKKLSYTAYIDKNEVYEGETVQLTEVVENRGIVPLPWVKTELCASRWLVFSRNTSAVQTSGGYNTFIPGVFSLGARSRCTRIRNIKCVKRGVFAFENTVITATDKVGIISSSRSEAVKLTVTVLPTPCDYRQAELSYDEPVGEILVSRFINDDPFFTAGSREYTGREPLNRINWNYTAALGHIMVRKNEYSTSRSVLVVMNMQRRRTAPVTAADIRDTEAFIKLSTAILRSCVTSGCRCAFATNGGTASGISSGMIVTDEHYESALRLLAGLPDFCENAFDDFTKDLNVAGFTDVYVLTAYIDDTIFDFTDRLNHKGITCAVYTTGEIRQSDGCQVLHIPRYSLAVQEAV